MEINLEIKQNKQFSTNVEPTKYTLNLEVVGSQRSIDHLHEVIIEILNKAYKEERDNG